MLRPESTVVDMALASVKAYDTERFLCWLNDKGQPTVELSYVALWTRALTLSLRLRRECALQHGDRCLLCYAPGPEFFVAFWGCLRASVVAVPVYPPDPTKLSAALAKLRLVSSVCQARVGLEDTTVRLLRWTTPLADWPSGIEWYQTDGDNSRGEIPTGDAEALEAVQPRDLAFLQFTSGTTGVPHTSALSCNSCTR